METKPSNSGTLTCSIRRCRGNVGCKCLSGSKYISWDISYRPMTPDGKNGVGNAMMNS